jgi:hypothetical protein
MENMFKGLEHALGGPAKPDPERNTQIG